MEIIDLAQELKRIRETSNDVIIPSQQIKAIEDQGTLKLDLKNYGKWPLTRHGGVQVAEKAGIPTLYFHKMLDEGKVDLAAQNVNGWFSTQEDNRLVRIADGSVRAVLSDRYRQLDNFDLAMQVMDKAKDHGAVFQDCQLTDTRMYLKLTIPGQMEDLKAKATPGSHERIELNAEDPVIPGLIVSNSEVGAGAFRVEPFVYRLVCKNGLIGTDTLYKVHLGGRMELGQTVYKDDTLQSMDRALWGQVRDIIEATFDKTLLHKQIENLRRADKIAIAEPQEALDAVVKDLSLSEEKEKDLLRYFAKESTNGETVFSLVNGITRLAQDSKNYDDRVEIERYAGQKLEKALAPIAQ
jgi:Domain of unknown function (DUF932)